MFTQIGATSLNINPGFYTSYGSLRAAPFFIQRSKALSVIWRSHSFSLSFLEVTMVITNGISPCLAQHAENDDFSQAISISTVFYQCCQQLNVKLEVKEELPFEGQDQTCQRKRHKDEQLLSPPNVNILLVSLLQPKPTYNCNATLPSS